MFLSEHDIVIVIHEHDKWILIPRLHSTTTIIPAKTLVKNCGTPYLPRRLSVAATKSKIFYIIANSASHSNAIKIDYLGGSLRSLQFEPIQPNGINNA